MFLYNRYFMNYSSNNKSIRSPFGLLFFIEEEYIFIGGYTMNRRKMKRLEKVNKQLKVARGQRKVLLHEEYIDLMNEVEQC